MGLAGAEGNRVMSRLRLIANSLLAICAVALTACGSSSSSDSGQTGTNASHVALLTKFSTCMRSHGVSSFPDPSTGQSGGNSFGIDGYNFNLPAGLNTQSPAYESADKTCQGMISSGQGGPARNPAITARFKRAALTHARCMRAHGVPNFPDPIFSSTGGGISVRSGSPGMNPRSPAFQQAQRTCGSG